MLKHTPGPYMSHGGVLPGSMVVRAQKTGVVVAHIPSLVSCPEGEFVPLEEAEANTRLFTAAPELLSIARRLAEQYLAQEHHAFISVEVSQLIRLFDYIKTGASNG